MYPTQAYAAFDPHQPLRPYQFERRALGPTDLLIEIHYCGVCHSDLHQVRDEWGGSLFPMVPGHEIVGLVSAVGPAVTSFQIGDAVGVGCLVDSCRTCPECHDHFEQFCPERVFTYGSYERDGKTLTQGGYANRIVVDQNFVLKVPANLPLDRTAPLLCAGITTYSPLAHWKAGPGKRVGILGLGGLGHMATKIAAAMGAEVTILSHSREKQADALALGAKSFYSTAEKESFKKLNGHFDLILNTVSAALDWNQYFQLLRREGTMVVVGIPTQPVPVHPFGLIMGRRSLAGSLIGGIKETQEMLDFCGRHNILADIELITMDKINTAYERMLQGDVRYRFVIDLKKSFPA